MTGQRPDETLSAYVSRLYDAARENLDGYGPPCGVDGVRVRSAEGVEVIEWDSREEEARYRERLR